ncbi:hypothetical protein B7P43_G15564, partial [Cryptotermes secundus]
EYMLLSRHQNARQNHDITVENGCFENVAQFRYLGTTMTNQNLIQEEINGRLNSGNACYHSVQNLLSFRLLSKNIKIRIYKTIILPVVLYGCETWSLTLREEHRVFENRSFPSIIRTIKSRRMRWAAHVARMGEKINAYRILMGKPEGKRPLGRQRHRWVNNIKRDLRDIGWDDMDWIDLPQDRDQWRLL